MKQLGPADASSLAGRLRVSAMAVRQHLYALMADRCVTYKEEPRPVGRPVKVWRLVASADRFFHDAHAELAIELLQAAEMAFGKQGLKRLLSQREQLKTRSARQRMPTNLLLEDRLKALVTIRNREGYMAEMQAVGAGEFIFVENHCPIRAAAEKYPKVCQAEQKAIRGVLPSGLQVERFECLILGDRRCAFRISRKNNRPADGGKATDSNL